METGNLSVSANGCLSGRGPAMSWLTAQGVTQPLPYESWERLQLTPMTLSSETSGDGNGWMLTFTAKHSGPDLTGGKMLLNCADILQCDAKTSFMPRNQSVNPHGVSFHALHRCLHMCEDMKTCVFFVLVATRTRCHKILARWDPAIKVAQTHTHTAVWEP